MKRTRFARRGGLTRDAEQLVWLATGLSQSGSRIEDDYWEAKLIEIIDRLLRAGNEDGLNAALDHLYRANGRAYDDLADLIEARAEGGLLATEGGNIDVTLIAMPVLAWSRYSIPCTSISSALLANARVQLQAHVLAAGVRLGLADHLYSPDQLPHGYSETRALAEKLTAAAIESRDFPVDSRRLPETAQYLSDMRYLLGVAVVTHGQPLFRWQEPDGSREHAASQWRAQGGAVLQPLFAGCALELVKPDAFHAACREADRQLRPYALRASVAYLQTALNLTPAGLRAVVAPFAERRLEEYRVGFTLSEGNEVVHGVVWPLLDAEDETTDTAGQIDAILRETGIGEVVILEHSFPLEYCDDCGGPLYPDPDGHTVHAEMPEQSEAPPAHLH